MYLISATLNLQKAGGGDIISRFRLFIYYFYRKVLEGLRKLLSRSFLISLLISLSYHISDDLAHAGK